MIFVAIIDVRLQCRLVHAGPVFMQLIDGIAIPWRSEDGEVAIPFGSAEDQDVMTINGAYGGCDALVKRFERRVKSLIARIVWDGLVEQIVAQNCGFVAIVSRQPRP